MGIISFPTITRGMTPDQLGDALARVIKDMQYVMDGNISSTNVREIAGYKVGINELKHKSGIVGMNGGDPTNPNAIRFWAGNANPAIAPFRVNQAGVMTAVGGQFMSASGYPRVEINSTTNLIGAYQTANDYAVISPIIGGSPSLNWFVGGNPMLSMFTSAFVSAIVSQTELLIQSNSNMTISASGTMRLDPSSSLLINGSAGQSGTVYVSATSGGAATIPISFTKGIRTT